MSGTRRNVSGVWGSVPARPTAGALRVRSLTGLVCQLSLGGESLGPQAAMDQIEGKLMTVGLELLQELRKRPQSRRGPFVILDSQLDQQIEQHLVCFFP